MSVKRLVPVHVVPLAEDPVSGRIGDIYYNTTDDELRTFDGTNWNAVGGAVTGLLDHVHTYDGAVFSVSGTELPSSGTIDGGGA